MNEDELWFERLAGHVPAEHMSEEKELAAIRRACLRLHGQELDDLAWRRMRKRLQTEGLWEPPRQQAVWFKPFATAAVMVLAIALLWPQIPLQESGFDTAPQEVVLEEQKARQSFAAELAAADTQKQLEAEAISPRQELMQDEAESAQTAAPPSAVMAQKSAPIPDPVVPESLMAEPELEKQSVMARRPQFALGRMAKKPDEIRLVISKGEAAGFKKWLSEQPEHWFRQNKAEPNQLSLLWDCRQQTACDALREQLRLYDSALNLPRRQEFKLELNWGLDNE